MSIPFSGQLGVAALGVLELGTIAIYGEFVPHRGHARSALTTAGARSTLSRRAAKSALSAATAKSEVT